MIKSAYAKKGVRIASFVLCTVMALYAFAPAARGAADTVKVGFFAMDGYHMEGANRARSGYGYEFLQLLARYSNLRFEYVGYDKSWEDMQKMLANGEIDLLTSAQKTPEREAQFGFTANPIGASAAILTVKAGDSRFDNGNYEGMRIGLVKGSSKNERLAAFMSKRGFSYTPVYYYGMNDLTAALQAGTEIDAAMSSNLRWTEREWTLETLDASPYYAIVRKEDAELLAQVDAAIERMDMDSAGWRTRLANKYYSMESGEVVAFTGEERAYLDAFAKSGRVLRVTMNPDCAPYSYFENGKPRGIISDIFAETAARMGIDYEMIKPADRADYQRLCMNGGVDVILDGMDDLSTIESNGLEITDVYYTTPIAALTIKSGLGEIHKLAQPKVTILNEAYYASMFKGKALDVEYDTAAEAADSIKAGKTDGVYMPYYCAQWAANADVTGRLKCLMLPKYERAVVYAVAASEDYRLITSLNKAVKSISVDSIAAIVTANTEYTNASQSLLGFVYQNLALVVALGFLFIVIVVAALFLAGKNRRAQKELLRSRRLERYIGYLCDLHYKVLEVDLDLKTRRQYMKREGVVEIEERGDFTAFDIDSIHPDDAEDSLAVFAPSAIRTLAAAGENERYVESRMRAESGEYRWYSFLLKLIPADKEHPCSAMLLIKDIDNMRRERERSQEALMAALDAANAASRSKSAFLSSMSHEIRTPLNAMIGYMTIAQTAIDNREKVLHCIDSAGVAARHLLSIINDVLDISSMESGKMKLARERFDLKEQISSIATVFYQQCRRKGIKFDVSIDGLTEEWVVGDAMRVNQILMNLMSNAVKFTGEGGVSLTVAQTAQNAGQVYIRFVVKDTGIGMSEEYISRLFEPFEQESAQTSRKYGGTGLGMSITLNFVNLMGGKIDVESRQGVGTAFTVTLPFGRTENNADAKTAQKDFSHLRVLIVDDLENECAYIHALLDRCGVHSESAGSGEEAIRLVALRKNTPERFDLCIIDWNMPGLNGVETTKLIHQECDPDIPIIIATAYDISEFEDRAISAGAAKIVSKPLFQSTLLDLLVTTYGKYSAAPAEDEEIPDLAGMHVLLAEDNETNVEVAVDLLELAGVTADIAKNGKEAVDLFFEKGENYDAILMDVQMPVMDGYAATRVIRNSGHPLSKTIPIIALTADAFAENVAATLSAGMDDHIAKPIETEILFAVLKKAYQKRGR